MELTPQAVKCDFCSEPDPTVTYEAMDAALPNLGWLSRGGWMACGSCSHLIDEGKWNDLSDRMVQFWYSKRGINPALDPEPEVTRSCVSITLEVFRAVRMQS
jgi:hypothetical protein